MVKICPRCKKELTPNFMGHKEGTKPSTDWFCEWCFKKQGREYVWYDSETKEGVAVELPPNP